MNCGYQDVSPNFSFSMNTLGNTAGSFAGILAPIVVAAFTTTYSGVAGWQASFLLTFAMSGGALLVWYFCAVPHVIQALNTPTPIKQKFTAEVDGSKAAAFAVSGAGAYRKKEVSSSETGGNKRQKGVSDMLTDNLL